MAGDSGLTRGGNRGDLQRRRVEPSWPAAAAGDQFAICNKTIVNANAQAQQTKIFHAILTKSATIE